MDTSVPKPAIRSLARDSEAYRFLMSEPDEGVYVFGNAIEDCNEAGLRLFGKPREGVIGRTFLEDAPEFQRDGSRSDAYGAQRFRAALEGQTQWFRWHYLKADGRVSEAMVHVEPVLLDGRRRLIVRSRDLLELERTEHAVAEIETRFQQILDHAPIRAWVKDLAGRYVFFNRANDFVTDTSRDQIIGRTDHDLFPAEEAKAFEEEDRRVIAERQPIEFEKTYLRDGDERTRLLLKFPILDRAGTPVAVGGISTDITARKRSEEALRRAALAVSTAQGERIFEELVRALSAVLDADVAFIALLGDEEPRKLRTVALVADGQVVPNIEYPLLGTPCADVCGRDFLFIESGVASRYPVDNMLPGMNVTAYAGYPLTDSAGRSLGLITALSRRPLKDAAFAESMTKIFAARAAAEIERQRTEDALKHSEASHRAIFENSEDAIFVHEFATGRIVDVNPKACANYGYTKEELMRASVEQLSSGVFPYTTETAMRLIERAKSGETQRFEWHRRNKDGSLHWDEVVLKCAQIGGVARIVAFTRDVTARKRSDEALRASEEQYRAIFNASADALILWNSKMKRVDVNAAYERIYGFSREEVIGRGYEDRGLPAEYLQSRFDLVRKALAGEMGHAVLESTRKGGERFLIEAHTIPIMHRGEPHALAIVRDITERARAEEERARLEAQLRQAQKMEAIGHLTGGIAHDFNNILASVMGNIGLAAEREAARGDARLSRYLEQAMLASRKARDLIRQMLTYSRGRKGEPRPVALGALLDQSRPLLRSSLPATVEWTTEVADDAPSVLADPVQIEQVLFNLCINARDAMRSKGTIRAGVRRAGRIEADCASCRHRFSGEFVELFVEDTGPGIAPEVATRMFEPFFTTKEVGKGSGLGLATVHGIVHEHGGHLVVESSPGRGTRFRVLLPTISEEAVAAATAPEPAALVPKPRLRGRVLLVDDEESVATVMADLLAGWGLAVTVAQDGPEALWRLNAAPGEFDLVLTDQTMPKLTGVQLAREIAKLRPGMPVILYTGFGGGIPAEQLAEAGIRKLLAKPVEPEDLLRALSACLPAVS